MSETVNVRLDREFIDELAEDKRDDENWTERIQREIEAGDARNVHAPEPLTREDVDDIATETASRVVRDLESALR
jgi:hypothetical protein